MKKFTIWIIVLILILICTLVYMLTIKGNSKTLENTTNYGKEFSLFFETNESNEDGNLILKKGDLQDLEYNIYTYGGDVTVEIDKQFFNLKEALLLNKISPNDIINMCVSAAAKEKKLKDTYKDGGTVVYELGEYSIIKFNTVDGNKSLFISKPEFSYDTLKTISDDLPSND